MFLFFHECLIQKVLPVRTASNECIKLAKSSFPQYVVSYPVLYVPYLQNILNFTTTHYHIKKVQFSLTPYSGAMTFFISFYRIAAYNKQIRCLAYAQGSTLEVRRAVLFVQWERSVCSYWRSGAPVRLASSMSARAPCRRSRCSCSRRWAPLFSSSSSSDWRYSRGSCCSWSAFWTSFPFKVGVRCSLVSQYLWEMHLH